VTITGYMTAKPIVVSQKQKNDAAKAESKYAPEAMYLVRFEWPHSFSSANKRVTAKDDRFEGVALKEDDDGWYVTTHRARGDSYPTPEDIPQSEVDFIESTGALHIAAREVCDECGYNLPHHGWGCSKAPRQIALCPAHRGGREFGRGSDDMKLTCAVCGEHGQNVGFYKMASTHTATGGSYWYHLTDKVDFRLDPKKRPHSNTTLGGDLEPGIFLTQSPEHWINGYGYRQPWIVEFEISGSPSDLGGAMNETGFEIYVSAEHYDKLRITRVMAFDGYCREEYGSWGWTEDDLGTTYDTFEPIPDDQMGNAASYNKWRGYHAPDARQADSSWQSAYSSRVKKWRRGKNNAIASLKMRITAAQHTAGATYWHGSPSGDFSDTAGIHVGTKQAATEALCARIGWPVGGTWDGTREYGKTLLMGNKTMRERGLYPTGYNYKRSHQDKDADFYADGTATYGDGSRIPLSVKPDIFEVEIVGEMTNTSAQPYDDFKANSYMSGAIKRGTPRKGYYYTNVGEDSGSISAVVPPGGAHLRRVSSFVARITAAIEASDPLAGLVDVYETMAKKEHTHSGLIIKAIDSGRVLMTQRTPYAEDPEGVYGRWEFPGGSIDEGEDAFESALREFREETGLELPEDWAVEGCFENKKYLAIVILVPHEAWTTNAELLSHEVMGLGWFDPDQIDGTDLAREEVDNTEWDLVKEAIVSYPEGHEHAPGGSGHPGDGRGARSARPGSVGAGDAPGVAGAGRGRRVASTVSVKVLPAAIKSYNALDAPVRSAVLSAVKQLKQDTMPTGAKGLTGPLSGFMSLKVVTSGGDYRVLYKIVTGTYVIVLDIGSRENFYDRAIRAKDKHRKQAGRYADDADAQGYYPAGADGRVKLYRSVSDYGSHFASWDEVQATLDEEWGGHFGQWWGTQDEANFYASDAIVVGALWDPADLHHDPTSSGLIAREGAKGEIVELTLGGRTVPVPAGRTVTAATGITYQVDIVKTPDSLMPGVPESATVHAFQGGHEVGTMLLHADFDAKNTKSYRRWKVWNVWVDEGARRQGIAEGLVLALHAETPDMWVYHGGFMSEAGEDFGKGLVSKYPKWNKLATLDTEGILHEEPEAALPSVDGSVEEVNDDPLSESAIKARMALLGGPEELDIVAAAEAHLAKTAVKTFTPMEQMELIEEGAVEGVTASNLDLLQIEGTHYEILARAQLDEVDFG
jgi:8-oxo-dGTP pyrophosphatase MutT (NUDIX family)/mRNA-degrading endonuclease RelE of RelBE toxin-antitoxin system